MSWWLVGTGADLHISLSHTGVWSLNGRPSPRESQQDIVHDQAVPADIARMREARVSWHLSASLDGVTNDPRYVDLIRQRRAQSPDVTLAAAVFWRRPHGDDTLEFHLAPPPHVLDVLRPMFGRIIGRTDLSYRIASALIKDREVKPTDWPTVAQLVEGRPHFTAGVEFSIFATALLKH